jgi:hypothetical protein
VDGGRKNHPGQAAVDEKSSEIKVIPKLLELLCPIQGIRRYYKPAVFWQWRQGFYQLV